MKLSRTLSALFAAIGLQACTPKNETQVPPPVMVLSRPPLLPVPSPLDLEQRVYTTPLGNEAAKSVLLEFTRYSERVHSAVGLFLGNYIDHSGDLRYLFEHPKEFGYWPRGFDSLTTHSTIQLERTEMPDRQDASVALKNIFAAAKKEGKLREAASVVGYLDYAAAKYHGTFGTFTFFYALDEVNQRRDYIYGWYHHTRSEVSRKTAQARILFDSLPTSVQDALVQWVGFFGHHAMSRMTSTEIFFEEQRVTHGLLLPELPEVPKERTDAFYRRFGEDILRGYGIPVPERTS